MKIKYLLIIFTLLTFSYSISAQKNDVDESLTTISNFKKTDPKIAELFSSSYGYVVFPGVGKGGLGVGGASGKGTVFNQGTAVADSRLWQVTIGLQAGGQKYAEVIFFENKEAYNRFVGAQFEFAAQVSAIALKSGASADATYRDGILVFTQSIGGLMYEASIGGQKFSVEMYE